MLNEFHVAEPLRGLEFRDMVGGDIRLGETDLLIDSQPTT